MTKFLDPRNDRMHGTLYVVTAIVNPARYTTRYKLYQDFKERVAAAGAVLVTAEIAIGERDFAVTDPGNQFNLQLRTQHLLWHKENMLNLAIGRLPPDWKYVAWMDADVLLARPDWKWATLHALQHYQAIQMWSQSFDLNSLHEACQQFRSFMWCYRNPGRVPPLSPSANGSSGTGGKSGHYYWHPGYAWAFRREAIDALGGLIDFSILGGGDMFMARALVGILNKDHLPASLGESGRAMLMEWQERAENLIRRNVGYLDGLLLHYWHGKKANRAYGDRGQVLLKAQFDPASDLKRDWQGLWQLTPRSWQLRDGLREYLFRRREDSESD